jgi:hypothetical protein
MFQIPRSSSTTMLSPGLGPPEILQEVQITGGLPPSPPSGVGQAPRVAPGKLPSLLFFTNRV